MNPDNVVVYLPKSAPVLVLCRALWDGESWEDACARSGLTDGAARTQLWRLRRRVSRSLGREIRQEYLFRLIFCPPR